MKIFQGKIYLALAGMTVALTSTSGSSHATPSLVERWIPQDHVLQYHLLHPAQNLPPTPTVLNGLHLYKIESCMGIRPSSLIGSIKILPRNMRNQKPATVTLSFWILEDEEEKKLIEYTESYEEDPYATGTPDAGYFPFPKKKTKVAIPEEATSIRIETMYAAPSEVEKASFPSRPSKPSFKLYISPSCEL